MPDNAVRDAPRGGAGTMPSSRARRQPNRPLPDAEQMAIASITRRSLGPANSSGLERLRNLGSSRSPFGFPFASDSEPGHPALEGRRFEAKAFGGAAQPTDAPIRAFEDASNVFDLQRRQRHRRRRHLAGRPWRRHD